MSDRSVLALEPRTRLADVTFCVLDLETTGTSDETDEIVEIGAVLARGGQQLGTFQTMVRHPLASGPGAAPSLGSVLASLLEFVRGSVIVGHNIRFDLRFLNAALWKCGHDLVLDPADAIDTVPLARRLLRDDADDCRLGTLAERFAFDQRPTHRALADALATLELLHLLIERATHYGALDLDDLARLPSLLRHRHRAKLATTAMLPRAAGVACLVDRHGGVVHVAAADDLRHAVRHLFDESSGTPGAVLQQLHRVHTVQTTHPIVARLATLRWSTATAAFQRPPIAYLQLGGARAHRVRMVAQGDDLAIVAGPLPRPLARQAVAALAEHAVDLTDSFVTALRADVGDPIDESLAAQPVLVQVVEQQRLLARGRALRGMVAVGNASLDMADGRVLDVLADGRAWRDVLPPCHGADGPRSCLSAAAAAEAVFVAQLLDGQPGCEMRDT